MSQTTHFFFFFKLDDALLWPLGKYMLLHAACSYIHTTGTYFLVIKSDVKGPILCKFHSTNVF